jgi:Mrp family chromosome partitioning ATPase
MNETADAPAIFAPLWRRKWLILAVGVVVAALSYLYYKRQTSIYSASTQIYLGSGAEEQGLASGAQAKGTLNDRAVTDQATLINSSAIGEPVHRRLRSEHKLAAAQGKAHASAGAGSDFVTITAEAHTAKGAVTLAGAYAHAYVEREHSSYRHKVRAAIAATRRQLRRIEATQSAPPRRAQGRGAAATAGASTAATSSMTTIQAADLVSKINQLESNLSVAGVQEISPSKVQATLLSPQPKRNALFGFALGLLLAAIMVYLVSRLDRRPRALSSIEELFGAQVLAALPPTREKPVRRRDGRLAPASDLLEPLRRLHTTLQLGDMLERDRERSPRTLLFVSADAGDGVSTVIADLALVARDAGERVAVVDADLRRPAQARLLEVAGPHGLTEVLAGTLTVPEALQRVEPLPYQAESPAHAAAGGVSTLVQARTAIAGSVSVLASGGAAANPPALLASRAMTELLRGLAEDFDRVLIDAPAPLQVSDVMPLLGAVDGIVLVARAGRTREVSARRLMQLLARVASAPVLGVVANCVPRGELEHYGFAAAPGGRGWARKLTAR